MRKITIYQYIVELIPREAIVNNLTIQMETLVNLEINIVENEEETQMNVCKDYQKMNREENNRN